MRGIFGRIILGGWALVVLMILIMNINPQLLAKLPHREYLRLFLGLLLIASFIYGIASLYLQGMRRSSKRP